LNIATNREEQEAAVFSNDNHKLLLCMTVHRAIDEAKHKVYVREDFFKAYSILFTTIWDARRIKEK